MDVEMMFLQQMVQQCRPCSLFGGHAPAAALLLDLVVARDGDSAAE